MSKMCLVPTTAIQKLANEITQKYPDASKRNQFSLDMCAEWIGLYNDAHQKIPDNVPSLTSLVNYIEKTRNKEGKSFKRDLEAEERQRVTEQEMQEIKARAIADGTFMKAPNGNPTNLTERQWLQVRTKAFKKWFGDWINDPANSSKVVDENGEPLVVYHHTDDPNLNEFSTDFENYFAKDGGTKEAIFFDEEKTGTLNRKYDLPVFLNIRELNEYNETKQQLHDRGTTYREVVNASARKNNKTGGVHMKDFDDNKKEHQSIWIIHNANQVKSATDNNGMFSTENNSILASPQAYEEIPVEALGEIADEVASIEAYDSLESSDADLNKKFGGKTEATVSELLDNLLASNTPFEDFVKALKENIGELGNIQVKLVPNSYPAVHNLAGVYVKFENTIYINRNASFKGKDGKADNTILHEIVHAIVANSLNTAKHREELNTIFEEAREKILKKYNVSSFEELPENLRRGRLYGLQNLDEFSAEFFTNSEFISELNDENTFGKRSDKKSIISRLVEWIKSLLPKGVTETYKRSGEILEDILLNSGGTIQSFERRDLLTKNGNNLQDNTFINIDKAIISGKWSDKALDELENLNIDNYGKILKRFSQEELGSSDRILAQAETIIARGGRSTDFENTSSNRERTERQEQQVETWAKENGLWYNDYQESKDGSLESVVESDGGVFSEKSGSESLVYWMPDGTAIKAIDASHYEGDLHGLFDKIMLHNSMFPETSYTVLGFGKDRGGTFRIIVKQTIIRGERPTTDDILEFIEKLDLKKKGGWYYTGDGKRFTDFNYGNIIKVGKTMFVIDCDVEFTPEYLASIDGIYAQQQSRSTVSTLFKQGIETLAGYYEGGGRLITDDFPGVPNELDDKLNNHFMGGEELSDADYYELNKYVRVIKNPDPNVVGAPYIAVPKHQSQQVSNTPEQSSGSSASQSEESASFNITPQELAEIQEKQKNNPPSNTSIARPISPSFETALKVPTSEQKDFYTAFSPNQMVDRAKMITSMFSDIIDKTIRERKGYYEGIIEDSNSTKEQKEKAEKALETFNDPILARVAAVDYKTYSGILDDIKKQLRTRGLIARNPEVKQKLQNTVKYFDLLVNEAVKWIEQEEGIPRHNEKTSEETDQDNEDFGDNEEGNASNGNDGWISRDRYINPFRGLSKQVKRVLNGIASGEYDDLGNSKTYTQGFVYSALMSYLSKNIESPDDFMTLTRENDYSEGDVDIEGLPITKTLYPYGYPHFPALEKMAVKYPWAKQVIARLTKDWRVEDAEDGTQLKFPPTYGSLASQFYTNFRKAFIPYAKVQIGINPKDGKPYFGTTPLNYDMEERSQRDELENSYNNGITYSPDSVYNADKTLNIENAKKVRDEIEKYINGDKLAYLYTAFNDSDAFGYEVEDEYKKQRDEILNLIKAFGINLTKENVESLIKEDENAASLKSMLADLREIANQIAGKTADKNYFVDIVDRYNKSVWDSFFKGRGFVTEVNLMQSFYDPASKKTMYSYSGDNYLQRTMRFLFSNNISKERRQQYLDEHFGNYEWFRDQKAPKGQGWKSLWLEHAYNANNLRDGLPYMNINSIDEITDGEHVVRPYNNWTEEDKYHVVLRSYDSNSDDFGYYLSPIFADSPMSMCVRGPKFTYEQLITGTYDESGKFVPSGFMRIIDQELQRIKYIREDRAKAIKEGRVKAISNYEKNGSKFCIIPELNDEVFGPYGNMSFAEYITQLRDEYEGAPAGDLDAAIQEAEIQAINYVLDQKLNQWLLEMPENIISELGGDIEDPLSLKENMRVQYYNMVYAAAQIVELTTVDTAFYKNSTDFQKRFKEVYASGIRINTNSRFGRKAGRVAIIADEEVTSRSYNNIKAVIDRAGDRINKKDHDFILSCFAFLKDKKQGGINVSDAQALRSLSSLRSVLDMMGKWDKRTEAAYTRIKNGTWNRDDFDIVLQTLKPFVYSVIARNDGKGGQIPVPIQHKNSELVMLAMYDLICGGLKNSAKMRGINKFLEEATDSEGNPIVDMIQFESAGKAGNQGVININYSHKKVQDAVRSASIELTDKKGIITDTIFLDDKKFKKNTRSNSADNFDEIKTQLTHKLIDGDITQETFNRCMDYFQPTEEEVLETLRTYTTDRNGNINPEVIQEIPFEDYMIAQPTPEHHMDAKAPQGSQGRNIIVADLPEGFKLALQGKGKQLKNMSKEEIIDFYYNLIVENLLQDYAELKDIFKDKKSLRDKVMELAQSNPTYGSNFAEAFSLDSDGNFVLSPNSPTIFNKVQQLVNSVIKNHIAVQKVNGAALIQASGIGLSDELNLVFDKNGKPVGAECYLPATSRRFFEAFMKKERINGQLVDVLDIEALQKAKLDKAIGYRIPTENKSSMLPIIIKGFSPQQNGSTIFLPAEITALSGSDFDVDKMFLMLSDFYVVSYDKQSARRDYARTNALFGDILNGLMKAGNISQEDLESDEDQDWEDEAFKEWWKKNKENYRLEKPEIHIVEYDFSKTPKENGKRARNTMLVQIMYKILTSQEGAENMFNPQHFEDVKESSKMMQIMHDNSLLRKYMEKNGLTIDTVGEHLMKASENDLEDFVKDNDVERSPIYPQTFNYFHEQNMAGDALLAMFALQVSATAKFQRASIIIKPQNRFTINGREIKDVDKIFNGLGEHRLKNVSQFVGACADNGKDPNVTNFGATRQNAKVIAYMLRAGLSIKEAALVVNQPIMQLPKYKIFKLIGQERKYWKDSNVSSETLVKAILQPEQVSPEETRAIAIMCYKILEQAENLAELTSISRADSPNGGIAETFAKARLYKYKVDLYNGRQNSYDFPFYPIKEAISNTKIDLSKSEDEIRQQLQAEKMSMLQGFYSLGVQSFDSLLSPFFFMLDKEFDNKVVKKVLNNLPDDMSDDAKEKVLNALYNDFITFYLSEFALFGDENDNSTMKSKREYYLNEFPLEFSRILHNNPAIRDLIGTLITPSTYSGKLRLVFQNGSQRGQKEDMMRRITGLLYMQNPEDQEVANKLVKDLFIYSYFDNGLQFTADSFSTLFSTQLCTQINGYNEFLQQLGKNLDNKKIENFHMQFLNNHPEIAVNADRKVRSSDSIDTNITINAHQNHKFGNPLEAGVRPYEFINYKGIIYSLQSWDSDYITYTPIPRFGDSPKLYNAKKSINEMADDYNYIPKVDETDVWDDFNNWEADQAFMAEQAFLNNANPDFNDATQTSVPMNSQEKPTPTNEPSVQNVEQSNTSRYTESGLNQLGNTPC